MRKPALLFVLLTTLLSGSACAPRVVLTPADDLDAAWHDFKLGLTGTLSDVATFGLGSRSLQELPVYHHNTWNSLVGTPGTYGVMRCSDARLDGTVMTLTLRYGLVQQREIAEDVVVCRSTAAELRVSLDLTDIQTASLPRPHRGRVDWVEFLMTDQEIEFAEREFIAGRFDKCRMTPGLLEYGKWGDFIELNGSHRMRRGFISGKLKTEFVKLVERAKRVGSTR